MKRMLKIKKSFLYHFVIRFLVMIIIPIICFWWIYERVLTYYSAQNAVAAQQINMENSLSFLQASFESVGNIFVAVQGNQEIAYYLDYGAQKKDMFYGNFKDINYFSNELYLMSPYLDSLKIYSDNPGIIYAEPFVQMEKFAPGEEVREALAEAILDETVWNVVSPENEAGFPVVYGYQKVYEEWYRRCIGYIEIRLSPMMFADYFEMVSNLSINPNDVWTLYQGKNVIYTTEEALSGDQELILPADTSESGYEIMYLQNQYRNYLMIPELDLCIVCSGDLIDTGALPSGNLLSITISIMILLLMALSIGFFEKILSLSRRILAFASFVRESDPEHLKPFRPEQKTSRSPDEMDSLIDTYNGLIGEKSSLISQIQRMELFTKDAKYNALQHQIHPHFIYGTLETIRMTALQNRDEEVASMIFSLSSLIRYSVSISSKAVTLQDEIEIAKHYLSIQKIRFDERLEYDFRVDETLLGIELPSFILQPILENAVIYGIAPMLENCSLVVEVCREGSNVVIRVSNTGQLITRERLQEINELLSGGISVDAFSGNRNGLALNNIRERLTIFFDGKAFIRLDLRGERTVTEIRICKETMI